MDEHKRVREEVSRAYAKAIRREASCCGPKGVAAKLAGYERVDESAAPALQDSFGCGNPVAFTDVSEGDTVLDLGAGAGLDLLLASKKVGSSGRVIGIDMTEEMIARARQNISQAGATNVEVRKGCIEELPVEPSSVHWVISNCVINLSPEKHRVFAEIARVLKPSGRMLVSDIVVEDLPAWVRNSANLYSGCIAGAISEEEYVKGLQAAGLVDIQVRQQLVYDAAQLVELASSELPETQSTTCCGTVVTRELAGLLAGKVKSISIYARKSG